MAKPSRTLAENIGDYIARCDAIEDELIQLARRIRDTDGTVDAMKALDADHATAAFESIRAARKQLVDASNSLGCLKRRAEQPEKFARVGS